MKERKKERKERKFTGFNPKVKKKKKEYYPKGFRPL